MRVINVADCEPDDVVSRGEFHVRRFDLTERLGASVIGATVYEMRSGEKLWPYHFHHGVEECRGDLPACRRDPAPAWRRRAAVVWRTGLDGERA